MEMVLANLSSTRRVTEGDREYLVAPLTLIVPGVLNGSQGSLYYPPEQIQRSVGAWNGIPITLHHPRKDGKLISVKDGGVTLGVLRNAEYRDGLKVEGWFELDSLQGQSPQLVGSIESGEQIELSTGLYTDNRPVKNGEHEGRAYTHVAENYRPDHLAILPDEKGACSVEMGCGVNVNAYNPSQPRAADGKFGSGGGSGGGGGSIGAQEATKRYMDEYGEKFGSQPEHGEKTVRQMAKRMDDDQWKTVEELKTVHRTQSPEMKKATSDTIQEMKKIKVVETAWDNQGNSHHSLAGSKVPSWLSQSDNDADLAKLPSKSTANVARERQGIIQRLSTLLGELVENLQPYGNSSQPRDAKGRFGSGSGSGRGGGGDSPTNEKEAKSKLRELGVVLKKGRFPRYTKGMSEEAKLQADEIIDTGLLDDFVGNIQPHSKNTGRFKKPGQGTGRGDVHESAQMGAFDSTMLSEEDHALGADAYAQVEAGHNPISWVADEAKWQKAKASADKGNHKGATHWAVVTHIYKKMGGKTKEGTKNAYNPSQSRDATGKFGSGGGGSGGEEKSSSKSPKTPAELRAMTKGQLGTEYKSAIKQRDKQLEKAWKKPGNEKLRAGDLVQKEGDSSPLGKASARFDHANNEFKRRRMPTPRTLNIGQSTLPNPKEGDMPLTDNQRTAAVDKLLDCCWEQDYRETLEGLTDNQLTKLVKQTEDNEQLSLVANTAREALELPEDTTINAMPEALKKAIDAKKKKKSDGGDEEEEEEEEVKKTENQTPLTEEQWREQAPQEVREDLDFARNERARQKNEAIASVVGNLQGEERSKAEGVLLKLSTDDIKSITPIVPTQKRTANYGTVPPVDNEGGEELPMERRTWDFSPAAA